jgi:quinol monooxygenase YgiN
MVRMFVRHVVSDYGKWRQAYDAFDATRQKLGVVGAAVYRSADNDRDVTVTHDFESLDKAKAFAASTELQQAMGAAGLAGVPSIWFTNPA